MGVLVAGGTGALGQAVLRELVASGYEVTATWIVERERERVQAELEEGVRLVRADLMEAEGAAAAVGAVDAEYRDRGVRANAVLPSVIDTPANRAASPDADTSRWVPPGRIAKVIRFLVSEDSAPTSGAAVPV